MKYLLISIFCLTSAFTFAQKEVAKKDKKALMQTLEQQQKAWNEGNLERFMNGYWQSDSLKFIGKNGVTYGWEATLDRYKKGYPDKATMGELNFTVISIEMLGEEHLLMIGKWYLKRSEKEDVQGHFSLVWKKIAGKWQIIIDHSS